MQIISKIWITHIINWVDSDFRRKPDKVSRIRPQLTENQSFQDVHACNVIFCIKIFHMVVIGIIFSPSQTDPLSGSVLGKGKQLRLEEINKANYNLTATCLTFWKKISDSGLSTGFASRWKGTLYFSPHISQPEYFLSINDWQMPK